MLTDKTIEMTFRFPQTQWMRHFQLCWTPGKYRLFCPQEKADPDFYNILWSAWSNLVRKEKPSLNDGISLGRLLSSLRIIYMETITARDVAGRFLFLLPLSPLFQRSHGNHRNLYPKQTINTGHGGIWPTVLKKIIDIGLSLYFGPLKVSCGAFRTDIPLATVQKTRRIDVLVETGSHTVRNNTIVTYAGFKSKHCHHTCHIYWGIRFTQRSAAVNLLLCGSSSISRSPALRLNKRYGVYESEIPAPPYLSRQWQRIYHLWCWDPGRISCYKKILKLKLSGEHMLNLSIKGLWTPS